MEFAGYEFKGPYTSVTKVPLDARGVYVVVCLVDGELHCCLDSWESRQLGNQLKSHSRTDCWEEHVHGEIAYCYKTTTAGSDRDLEPNPLDHDRIDRSRAEQVGIESELRWKLDCPCGRNPWAEIEEYWEIYQSYEAEFGPRGSDGIE